MVARKRPLDVLIIIILPLLLFSVVAPPAGAQTIRYHLEYQVSKFWVNRDGSIDLFYNISIACDSGSFSRVYVGQPKETFTIGEAIDEKGNNLQTAQDFEEGPAVEVVFRSPINVGSKIQFTLTTRVEKMVYLDQTNPGNVGLQFIPTWWDERVAELRVLVVLPEGAVQDDVRNTPDYDNILSDPETGYLMLYWERSDLAPNAKFTVGVSFPKELVDRYEVQRTGIEYFIYDVLLPNLPTLIAGVILFAVIIVVIRNALKKAYKKPKLAIETLGIRRGLTAVEAAWLLGLGPIKTVVAMLFGLLQKRAVWVTEQEPKLKLEIQSEFRDKTGTLESPIRYYEHRFIESIREDGTLDEAGLASAVGLVRDTVEQKMRGYNRNDSVKYYQSVVDQSWKQVEGAGTPELASSAFDENLLWLYLDGAFASRLKTGFEDSVFMPQTGWWWYWWWARPTPTPPGPILQGPAGGPVPQPLPGAEFADKIVTSLERSANGMVSNLEKFADSVAPAARAETGNKPVRRGSGGSCACASCACACACVSCACACAGGRVR